MKRRRRRRYRAERDLTLAVVGGLSLALRKGAVVEFDGVSFHLGGGRSVTCVGAKVAVDLGWLVLADAG